MGTCNPRANALAVGLTTSSVVPGTISSSDASTHCAAHVYTDRTASRAMSPIGALHEAG